MTWLAAAAVVVIAAAIWWSGRGAAPTSCEAIAFEGSNFVACRYDPARHDLKLVVYGEDGQPLRGFQRLRAFLGPEARRVAFAMNAGMYDEQGSPIGLYVQDGVEAHALNTRDGPGNFHLKPNGVFWIDKAGRAHVAATDAYTGAKAAPRWASQSGPMLVVDGALHRAIAPNGTSLHVRNGVGACGRDGDAIFVISEAPVSFGRLARLFRDELQCGNALYLDGTVSSLWAPREGRMDGGYPLGPMVVVFDRPVAR
jgi:uncharacterized protein YigE (DUF2233 family)